MLITNKRSVVAKQLIYLNIERRMAYEKADYKYPFNTQYGIIYNAFFSLSAFSAGTQPSGSGTADDPYLIGSPEELIWFRDNINDGTISDGSCVDLTADIDLDGIDWIPICNGSHKYTGTFNGHNHQISNLYINISSYSIGFFRI